MNRQTKVLPLKAVLPLKVVLFLKKSYFSALIAAWAAASLAIGTRNGEQDT